MGMAGGASEETPKRPDLVPEAPSPEIINFHAFSFRKCNIVDAQGISESTPTHAGAGNHRFDMFFLIENLIF